MMNNYFKHKHVVWRRMATAITFSLAAGLMPTAFAQIPAEKSAGTSSTAALNFVNADMESVIQAVGHYTNVNFIIDPRVKGTLTLVSEKSLTKAQAFSLLASLLRMQGYAIVMGDGYAKVVPEADAKIQAGLPHTKGKLNGSQVATQLFRLNYESASSMVAVLKPLISTNNPINANASNNTLVITDYVDNLRRLGRIIAALDTPASSEFEVVPVRHAVASDVAMMANKLLEPGGNSTAPGGSNSAGEGRTIVLADVRQNAVVIRAPSAARANLAKSLIAKLDQPSAHAGNVHVVYLKNADATKLAQTLRAVFMPESAGSAQTSTGLQRPASLSTGTTGSTGTALNSTASAGTTTPQTSSAPTAQVPGFIQADASTNTLIITASEPVYRNLRTVIDQLDVRRAQIYIEALIAEVSAEKAAEFGVQWAGLSGSSSSNYRVGGLTSFASSSTSGSSSNNLINIATGIAAGKTDATKYVTPGAGLSLGVFRQINGELGLGAVAHVLQSDSNSNILSTPNLITLDNEEAKITIGQNVPFVTGQYTTTASSTSTVSPFQTVERKDVGLSLKVKPQVSEGGTVTMTIYQEISSVIPDSVNTVTGLAGLTTKKRSIETNVLADNGQIIVLGGLIEDNVSDSAEKVPGLGDLPLLGNAFKYQKRSRTKTNLMVFLRPTIIRSSAQSMNVVADRYDYIRGVQIATQPEQKLTLPDTAAPILPTLENGRPAGGLMLKPSTTVEAPTKPVQDAAQTSEKK